MPPKVCGSLRTTRTGRVGHRQVTRAPGCKPPDLLAVDDEGGRPVGRDLHRRLLVLGEHEAAVEGEVRSHRRDDHGAERGGQDRPAGGEVVGRRARSAWRR